MKYIQFNPETLLVEVTEAERPNGANIPVGEPDIVEDNPFRSRIPISSIIYQHVLYAAVEAEDKRRGVKDRAYFLVPPDPWLVALGMVMWQGLIQGMTWDSVKLSVRAALNKLRTEKVAPPSDTHQVTREEVTELGFCWVQYAGEKKQHEMFIGLRKALRSQSKSLPKAKRTKSRRKK